MRERACSSRQTAARRDAPWLVRSALARAHGDAYAADKREMYIRAPPVSRFLVKVVDVRCLFYIVTACSAIEPWVLAPAMAIGDEVSFWGTDMRSNGQVIFVSRNDGMVVVHYETDTPLSNSLEMKEPSASAIW